MSKSKPKGKILIADKDESSLELLKDFLLEVGCDLDAANDGSHALEKVASFRPDLILLATSLPIRSGFEFCQELKGDPQTSDIMILMISELNELEEIERAVDAGTDDFLSKPINKLELVKRVQTMLKLRHC